MAEVNPLRIFAIVAVQWLLSEWSSQPVGQSSSRAMRFESSFNSAAAFAIRKKEHSANQCALTEAAAIGYFTKPSYCQASRKVIA